MPTVPRVYEQTFGVRPYKGYSDDDLTACLDKIRNEKMKKSDAAEKFNIPIRTIFKKLREEKVNVAAGNIIASPVRKYGGQTIFSREEEELFTNHLISVADYGFPITKLDLRMVVQRYLTKTKKVISKFKNGCIPGPDWCNSFLQRNQIVSHRIAQNIANRAAMSEDVIRAYMENLSTSIAGVPAENIFNYVEANLSDDPGSSKVLVRRAVKYPELVKNSSKTSISLMMCGSASGEVLPPYVVYKSQELCDTWTRNGPLGAHYNCSPSGWFDEQSFEDWFKNLFLSLIRKKPGPKVLIGDNLSSHFSDEVLSLCKKHSIRFVCLPVNSTDISQPLDVAFFGPMKEKWQQILGEWRKTVQGQRHKILLKQEFPQLLKNLMLELSLTGRQDLRSAFEKCGIHPLNIDQLLDRLPDRTTVDTVPVEQSFEHFLVGTRQNAVSNNNNGIRRKKRKIIPGRSSTENSDADSNQNEENVDDPKSNNDTNVDATHSETEPSDIGAADVPMCVPKPTSKRGRPRKIPKSSDDPMEGPSNSLTSDTNISEDNLKKIAVGTFIIVQKDFTVNNIAVNRCYVGQIRTIFENKYEVHFMQSYRNEAAVYHFPDKDFKDFIQISQIQRILVPPKMDRGIFTFKEPPLIS